jgi:RNA polymerase sigma-70 factor (ECF subfamily)
MAEPSDEALVASVVARRDAVAFETLVLRYQSKVRNWLRQLARDAARADDLAQETFIRAWERAHTFSGKGRFASWIMKIAFNCYLQSRRTQVLQSKLAAAVAADELTEPVAASSDELPDLPRMLASLSDEERLTMILCYAHGLSHSEIAEIVEMPLGTVKSHLQRGRAKIRERFQLQEAGAACARRR